MECLATWRVAGPCSSCGEYQQAGMHIVDNALFCENCCPDCGTQGSLEWETEPATIAGTQGGLFE